jgi:hypothetical protein
MKNLPVDDRGYPIPYFAAFIDGKPDFRVMDGDKFVKCWREQRCWLCGEYLPTIVAAVIGPMCTISRTTAEPFSHLECAEFAVRVCPFLTLPKAHRRDALLPGPDVVQDAAGISIDRNPRASAVWITTISRVTPFRDGNGGILFNVGEPLEVHWYYEGRKATRAEVEESIRTGIGALESMAEEDGPDAVAELAQMRKAAEKFLPE